jgi:heat shock protein HslJ
MAQKLLFKQGGFNIRIIMKLFCISAIILVLIGCEKKDKNPDTGQVPLLKTQWTLSSIQNTKTNFLTTFPGNISNESIIFSDSANVLRVQGVCNICSGVYSLSDASVTANGLVCTKIYCSPWENYLFLNLDSMYKYKIENTLLTIYSKGSYNLNFISK